MKYRIASPEEVQNVETFTAPPSDADIITVSIDGKVVFEGTEKEWREKCEIHR